MVSRGFIPGFVWEESGRIVGNVTLLESPIRGRYLIANLAVHPDFRRRGIARGLMHEALAHIESRQGRQVLLQVESDNEEAIHLYHTLAFNQIGDVRRWQALVSRLRLPSPEAAAGPQARPLQRRQWREAFQLDRDGFETDLNWPAPPPSDYYKSGLLQRAADLLNGRRQETWVVEAADRRLAGLVDLVSEWNRPHRIRVCIIPMWRGELEGRLLHTAVSRLRRFRGGGVQLNYPAGDAKTEALLKSINFELRRALTVMRRDLAPANAPESHE
ncbi:MAG: GNAT family N-acetyltransferase [Chloroflexota bacterium]|nr:MAG: GNAT family N-acetyltransferase [Chloroflexota bacterium]